MQRRSLSMKRNCRVFHAVARHHRFNASSRAERASTLIDRGMAHKHFMHLCVLTTHIQQTWTYLSTMTANALMHIISRYPTALTDKNQNNTKKSNTQHSERTGLDEQKQFGQMHSNLYFDLFRTHVGVCVRRIWAIVIWYWWWLAVYVVRCVHVCGGCTLTTATVWHTQTHIRSICEEGEWTHWRPMHHRTTSIRWTI